MLHEYQNICGKPPRLISVQRAILGGTNQEVDSETIECAQVVSEIL